MVSQLSKISQYREDNKLKPLAPPKTKEPSGMLIASKHKPYPTHNKTDRPLNIFDEKDYCYYFDMLKPRTKIKYSKLAKKIIEEYKIAHPKPKIQSGTSDQLNKILLWLFSNPDQILVIEHKMSKYRHIKSLFVNLESMGVVHLHQGFPSDYYKPTPTKYHRAGIFATFETMERLPPKNRNTSN